MKKITFLTIFLAFSIALSPLCCYAETISLGKLLRELTGSKITSLEKSNIARKYKGEIVKGTGIVKDIIKTYGAENNAMVYLKKKLRNKEYEIVLIADEKNVHKIRKGKNIAFKGKFAGTSYDAFRFEEVEILEPPKPKPFWSKFGF